MHELSRPSYLGKPLGSNVPGAHCSQPSSGSPELPMETYPAAHGAN